MLSRAGLELLEKVAKICSVEQVSVLPHSDSGKNSPFQNRNFVKVLPADGQPDVTTATKEECKKETTPSQPESPV